MDNRIKLEHWENEALLFNGTSQQDAEQIAKQGFDEGRCRKSLYGLGEYL